MAQPHPNKLKIFMKIPKMFQFGGFQVGSNGIILLGFQWFLGCFETASPDH